jgi:RNA polymerase sigma-70 factor (ECF subfamily)
VDASPTSPSDNDLVASVAGGDAEALVLLFRRRRVDVYRFALHMTGAEAAAEDVTQEVFMTVMREAARYDASRGSVMAWLCGITRNFAKRRLERERFLQPFDNATESQPAVSVSADPLDDLARAERIVMVRRAIMSLPVRYREVVLLCDLQELSYADAATALNCAVGTLRSRLHRGRTLLAAKMRQLEGSDQATKLRRTRCFA